MPGLTRFVAGQILTADLLNAILTVESDTVATTNTITSTSYVDATDPGPTVGLTTGPRAIVILTALITNSSAAVTDNFMSYTVSGATTIAASDARALSLRCQVANDRIRASVVHVETGLEEGFNTFTAKYRVGAASNMLVQHRGIVVLSL